MAAPGQCTLCGSLRAVCKCLDRPKVHRNASHAIFDIAAGFIESTRYFGQDAANTARKLITDAKSTASRDYLAGKLQGFNVLTQIERDALTLENRVKAKLFGTAQKMKERKASPARSKRIQSDAEAHALVHRIFPKG